MLRFRLILFVLLASSTACNQPASKTAPQPSSNTNAPQNGQWILESYDSAKGYTFSKDGVTYQTRCYTISETFGNTSIPSPKFVSDQSQCSGLLLYLHKSTPIFEADDDPRYLNFTTTEGLYRVDIELQIEGAK